MNFKKLNPLAYTPTQAYENAVGYDLYCIEGFTLMPGVVNKIPTGLAVELPTNHVGLLRDRGSMGAAGIITMGGVVDPDYRGEIVVMLLNGGHAAHHFTPGSKICQMIVMECVVSIPQIVDELSPTARSDRGFGSSNAL